MTFTIMARIVLTLILSFIAFDLPNHIPECYMSFSYFSFIIFILTEVLLTFFSVNLIYFPSQFESSTSFLSRVYQTSFLSNAVVLMYFAVYFIKPKWIYKNQVKSRAEFIEVCVSHIVPTVVLIIELYAHPMLYHFPYFIWGFTAYALYMIFKVLLVPRLFSQLSNVKKDQGKCEEKENEDEDARIKTGFFLVSTFMFPWIAHKFGTHLSSVFSA